MKQDYVLDHRIETYSKFSFGHQFIPSIPIKKKRFTRRNISFFIFRSFAIIKIFKYCIMYCRKTVYMPISISHLEVYPLLEKENWMFKEMCYEYENIYNFHFSSFRYTWQKNGKPYDWQVYDDRISQQPGRGTLVITSPRDEDIGKSCINFFSQKLCKTLLYFHCAMHMKNSDCYGLDS